jgi:zinc transporter
MAEELEAVRERSALLHEQITDLRAEKIDRRSLIIAIVAMIFLPLTFLTGLLGMNVDSIPYAHTPHAFWGVTAFSLLLGAAVTFYFARARWFSS